MATAAAFLFVCLAFGFHLVLHELHGDRHESAESTPSDAPAHEHHLVPSISSGVLSSLAVVAASPLDGVTPVAGTAGVGLVMQPALTGRSRFGAIRSGPRLALQPLLSTFLI